PDPAADRGTSRASWPLPLTNSTGQVTDEASARGAIEGWLPRFRTSRYGRGAVDIATIKAALNDYIVSEILLRDEPLAADEDLFDAGFDSMSLSRVLVFVEERFGVAIPDEDVVIDEIATLDALAAFVAGYFERA